MASPSPEPAALAEPGAPASLDAAILAAVADLYRKGRHFASFDQIYRHDAVQDFLEAPCLMEDRLAVAASLAELVWARTLYEYDGSFALLARSL